MVKNRAQSANSLKILRQCEFRYLKKYVEEVPEVIDPSSPAPFGKAVHRALEELYKLHKSRYGTVYRFSQEDYQTILDVFVSAAAEEKLYDASLLEEGRNMLFSKMDCFDYSENVIDTERRFLLPVGDSGVEISGIIDKIVEIAPDTVAVVDYKTSRVALTQTEADDDIQLSMYDLAVSILYPQYHNVVLVLDYLRLRPVFSHRTPSSREMFVKFLDETVSFLSGKTADQMLPTLNSLCGWCQYKAVCPAFIKASTEYPEVVKSIEALSAEDIIERWKQYKNVAKVVDAATNSLKMRIEKLRQSTGMDVSTSKERIYASQTTRVWYNAQTLADVIPANELIPLCSVNKAAIDRYLADHLDIADKVRALGSVSYTAPVYRVSKNRVG